MSRTGSTTSLPSSQPGSSDGAASFQDERLSDYTTGDCPTPRADVIELDDDPDADTFWVDWDGPDDPENPQKWAMQSSSSFFVVKLMTLILFKLVVPPQMGCYTRCLLFRIYQPCRLSYDCPSNSTGFRRI